MLPRIDYLHVNEIVENQKKAVYKAIQTVSEQSHTVFPGLKFSDDQKKIDPKSIPGLGRTILCVWL